MDETDGDYVTVLPTQDPHRFLACVMVYRKRDDDYVQSRVSKPLTRWAADGLAAMWASTLHLSVR